MYYSLIGRDIERDLVPLTERYGIGITVWSPLASGFLSGKYVRGAAAHPDNRLSAIDFIPFDKEKAFDLIDELRSIADGIGASVAQVALAWLLAKRAVSSVVVGASKPSQLADNLGAIDVSLDSAMMDRLDALTRPIETYPHWHWRQFADAATRDALALS